MASSFRPIPQLLRLPLRFRPSTLPKSLRPQYHPYSTPSASSSTTLSRLRPDLKSAMLSKSAPHLSAIRTLLSSITEASKTSSPITTDILLLPLLTKKISQISTTILEAESNNRPDLVSKASAEKAVLEEYRDGIETVSDQEIRHIIGESLVEMNEDGKEDSFKGTTAEKARIGEVMKRVLGPGGKLDGKPVEKGEVARVAKEMLNLS